MAIGMQAWDANGNLIFDLTSRVGRILGTVSNAASSGTITNAQFSTGTPFCIPICNYSSGWSANNLGSTTAMPLVSFSNNTMSWQQSEAYTSDPESGISVTLLYGVY
ncbi:hypothetical protein [Gallaecimonas mangrovi]|uniref:hypothetical protein n=1 Tax=Gallaecimonas mangrovi TaxID=2291597 RepID=UPI000E20B943|nr:hypothetical protein [Gallaecimonas mangrovi]